VSGALPWTLLGIAPTSDARAIRRAYATQLKAFDADTDPERFAALRTARDRALQLAVSAETPGDDAAATGLSAINPFRILVLADVLPTRGGVAVALAPDVDAPPWLILAPPVGQAGIVAQQIPICADMTLVPPLCAHGLQGTIAAFVHGDAAPEGSAHFDAIIRILFEAGERRQTMPSPEEEVALIDHFTAIRASRRIEEMGYYADVERWCADIIAHGAPASRCLMKPAADFFNWHARAGELGESDPVAFINRQLAVWAFIDTVSEPSHRWHRAWAELTSFAHEHSRRGRGVKREHVRELLEAVRRERPEVEQYFDGMRVALWENPAPKYNLPVFPIGVALLFGLSLMSKCSDLQKPPASPVETVFGNAGLAPPDLTRRAPEIDAALREAGFPTLTLEAAEAGNPELANMLKSNWEIVAREGRGMQPLAGRLRAALDERVRMSLATAPAALVRDLRRMDVERARLVQRIGPERCDRYWEGSSEPPPSGFEQIEQAQAKAIDSFVLETRGPFSRGGRDVTVPGYVIERIMAATRLPEQRVRESLRGEADAADRCAVRIALIEAALAIPARDGLPILRGI
jgi:hypothetical protein